MLFNTALLLSALWGCGDKDKDASVAPADADKDGDGFSENQGDCDDSNGDVNPGATEVCDGVDNDCNDQVDDADLSKSARARKLMQVSAPKVAPPTHAESYNPPAEYLPSEEELLRCLCPPSRSLQFLRSCRSRRRPRA